jgi:uncharacterized protein (DUF2062 family)
MTNLTKPRKLSMPLLKDTTRGAVGVAAVAGANTLLLPKLARQSPIAASLAVVGEIGAAVYFSNKYPMASASVAGGVLNALFTALAAYVSNDYTLIAWNPQMEREIRAAQEGYADFPEALAYALGA